jgi:parvulin-like peptidyl-prolyl isomerase
MFLNRIVLLFLAGIVLLFNGCGSNKNAGKFTEEQMADFPLATKQGLPEPSGGLVLNVGDETITVEEIITPVVQASLQRENIPDYKTFKEQAWPQIANAVLEKASRILMYYEAKKTAPGNIDDILDKAAEQEVNRFIANYKGNYAEAQKVIEEMGMDWNDFRDYIKRSMLIASYAQKSTEDKFITQRELLEYYNSIKEERFKIIGTIEFWLIDINTTKINVDPDESKSAKESAVDLAEKLIERINQGEDFSQLAKEYSHDHRAEFGGLWTPVTIGEIIDSHRVVEENCLRMLPGQVAGPFVSAEHVFIIKLKSRKDPGYESFEEVQHMLKSEIEFKHRLEQQYEKTVAKLMEQADIPNLDEFTNYCVEQAYLQIKANQ